MTSTEHSARSGAVGEASAVYWALLLHFYQPPHQILTVLRRVVEESYLPLIEVFRQHRHARATVNINGVLTDMLWDGGFREVITGLRDLAERGQIEFTGSGKYHPILPLLPRGEQARQIELNTATNRRIFGSIYQPRGFFPPEMCYSDSVLPCVLDAGFEWIALSSASCPVAWPTATVHRIHDDNRSLGAFFRDGILSNKISFRSTDAAAFLAEARRVAHEDGESYLLTAMDAETFGHHVQDWDQEFLSKAFDLLQPDAAPTTLRPESPVQIAPSETALRPVVSASVSEVFDRFPAGQHVTPVAASWSTSPEDLHQGVPYPLWDDPSNALHQLLWKHLRLALALVHAAEATADTDESRRFARLARALLDQAEHSCQWWWASRRPMWDVNLVHRGLMEQQEAVLNAARAIRHSTASDDDKDEQLYRYAASRRLVGRIMDLLVET